MENLNQDGNNLESKPQGESLETPRMRVDQEKIRADMATVFAEQKQKQEAGVVERSRQAEEIRRMVAEDLNAPTLDRKNAAEIFQGEDEAHARQVLEDRAREPKTFLRSIRERLGI